MSKSKEQLTGCGCLIIIVIGLFLIGLVIPRPTKPVVQQPVVQQPVVQQPVVQPITQKPADIEEFNADELLTKYNENGMRFEKDYKGKRIEVTGEVVSINKQGIIELKGFRTTYGAEAAVKCNASEQSQLLNITIGQTISVVGKFDRKSTLQVWLKDGKITNTDGMIENHKY